MSTTTSGWSSSEDCVPDVPMSPEERDGIIKKQVQTFTKLYRKKLSQVGDCDELKVPVLEHWVRDLTAQNEMLRESLCDIERNFRLKSAQKREENKNESNANAKIQELESIKLRFEEILVEKDALQKSVCEKDSQISRVKNELRVVCQSQNEALQQSEALSEENCKLQEKLDLMQKCVNQRDSKINEMNCQLTELTDILCNREAEMANATVNEVDIAERVRELETELECCQKDYHAKDQILKNYARENTAMKRDLQEGSCSRKSTIDVGGSGDAAVLKLQKKLDTQRDLQIALTGEVAEKHDTIIALKEQIHELEGKLRQTEIQAHFKDDIIRELRKEVKLGRAKESLAEMLGLKEGPRVQMKARIDRLNSELEERANEIVRLNTLVDSSALVNLENQVKTLTLDLSSRDKKILSLCDKMDYVRSYLNQLKSEEQLSIKCGLEALITELTDDAQNIREVRRNVSISLDREPNESVIIINHRSHSLPDSTLQKQVNTFKTSSKIDNQNFLLGMPSQSTKFALKDLSRLKQLGVSLETSRTNLCDSWNAVKHFNTADFAECCAEIDSTLARIDADRSSLNVVCNHFEVFTNWLADTHNRCSNNIFLFTSVQECLGGILEKLDKNFVHYPDDDEFSRTNTSLFHTLQSSINLVMSQLVKLESNCMSQNDAVTKIDLEKLKENQKCLARIASNKMVDIKQLTSVKTQHDSIAKSLEEKLSELDANFLQHINATNSVESELEMIVERLEKLHGESSLISVYTSTDDLQSADTEEKPGASVMGLETVLKKVDSSKLLELMDNDGQMVELFAPSPFHSKFSNSSFTSDWTSKEGIETPLGIEVRGALMNGIARSLCTEINNLITQVIHRDQKIFNFEKSGFNLCNSLDQTQKEIENILSASTLSKNVDSECLSTLNTTLTTTACQVQNLLTQAKVYMSEREMIEALRLKKEQGICSMMSDLVKTTEEVIADVKMFEQENKAAENDALKRIVAEKDDKIVEIVAQIHALEDKLAKLEDQLKIEIREKILLKAEKERTMEEMQSKISKLQTALQEDKIPPQEISRLKGIIEKNLKQFIEMDAEIETYSLAAIDLRVANSKLKEKYADDMKSYEEENEKLRLEKVETEEQLIQTNHAYEQLKHQLKEYNAELIVWKARSDENKKMTDQILNENRTLRDAVKEMDSECNKIITQLREAEDKCKQMMTEKASLLRKYNDSSEKCSNCVSRHEYNVVNAQLKELNEKCQQLVSERAATKMEYQKVLEESEQWEKRAKKMNDDYNSLYKQLKQSEEECKTLTLRLTSMLEERKLEKVKEEENLKSYREQIVQLDGALILKDSTLDRLQQELKNVEKQKLCSLENQTLSQTDQAELRKVVSRYKMQIEELLKERKIHLEMMNRMRNFTGHLSKAYKMDADTLEPFNSSATSELSESTFQSERECERSDDSWY